jgi:hypothetical protein
MYGSGTRSVVVGREGGRVREVLLGPIGGRGGRKGVVGAIKEVMAKVTKAAEVVDSEGKKLDVLGVEGRDNVNTSGVIAVSSKFRLCFLIVPVMSGIRISGDTLRSRGRPSDDNINSKEGGGVGNGMAEVAGEEEETNIGRTGKVVGDEVAGFDRDAVTGGNKVGPWGNFGANGVESVADVGAEGGFVGMAAAKEVVSEKVEGFTAGTVLIDEFRRETREAKLSLESKAVGVGGKKEVGLTAGKGAEGGTGREVEERREVGGKIGGGGLGDGSRELAEVSTAKVSAEVVEREVKD